MKNPNHQICHYKIKYWDDW